MPSVFEQSLRDFINASASSSPTPGGGSVSAVVGCLGLAMTTMVCNLTLGKEKYASVDTDIKNIINNASDLLKKLELLVDADIEAFGEVMGAYRLPKTSEKEQALREEALQKALKGATDTPMDIARACLEGLKITGRLSSIGSKMVISDAGVAVLLTEAALAGVLLNVDINISLIRDREYVQNIISEKEKMIADAAQITKEAMAVVRERMK